MCWIVIDRLHTCPGFKKIINKTLDGRCRQHFSSVMSNAQHPNTHRCILVKLHLHVSFPFNSQYVHQVVLSPKNKLQVPPCGCGSTASITTLNLFPFSSPWKELQTYGTNLIRSSAYKHIIRQHLSACHQWYQRLTVGKKVQLIFSEQEGNHFASLIWNFRDIYYNVNLESSIKRWPKRINCGQLTQTWMILIIRIQYEQKGMDPGAVKSLTSPFEQ